MSLPSTSKDPKSQEEIPNKILNTVVDTAFMPYSTNLADLRYEHFIGPLVTICFANDSTNESESIVKLCYDQFERYYTKVLVHDHDNKRSNSYSGKPQSLDVNSLDAYLNFITSSFQFMKNHHHTKVGLLDTFISISFDKVETNYLVF